MHMLRAVRPAVEHAAREWLYGAPPAHALYEASLTAYLIGRGMSPLHALRAAERAEAAALHGARVSRHDPWAMARAGMMGAAYELTEPLWDPLALADPMGAGMGYGGAWDASMGAAEPLAEMEWRGI